MLKNTKLATQVIAAFSLIIVLIVALGVFNWVQVQKMDRALLNIADSMQVSIDATELDFKVNDASLALKTFETSSDPADGVYAVQRMLLVRDTAEELSQAGLETAAAMVTLKERHIEELSGFVETYSRRRELKDIIRSKGIEYRRAIGRLTTLLEERNAEAAAYRALRASEKFLVTRVRVDRFVDGAPVSDLDSAEAPYKDTLRNLSILSSAILTEEERTILNSVQSGLPEFWESVAEIREVELRSRAELETVHATTDQVLRTLATVRAEAQVARNTLNEQAHTILNQTVHALEGGLALVVLLSAGIAAFLSITMSRGLKRIVMQTTRLAEGDLETEISHADGRGDLARMAHALTVFKDNALTRKRIEAEQAEKDAKEKERLEKDMQRQRRVVGEIETALKKLADGELTHKIDSPAHDPFPSEYDTLRLAFNEVVDTLSQTLSRIVGVAEQVRGGSDEITSAAQDLAGRAETQAATLEQSAAALNELSESVRSTAELARDAEKATQENRETAESGSEIVGNAIDAMQRIEQSSEQITRIIGVIDDIAFQTNLLALNAGVEAARAGEAGRGFAVVASEVRGLAQRASESAREIKALISESTQQVEEGSSLVTRTGQSLEQILQKAKQVSEQASAIAVAASDQASALGEINTGINQLDQVTQQNAAVAEETNAATGSLMQQSSILISELASFKFDRVGVKTANISSAPLADYDSRDSDLIEPAQPSAKGGQNAARMIEF